MRGLTNHKEIKGENDQNLGFDLVMVKKVGKIGGKM